MRRFSLFFFAMHAVIWADTLTLRNGTTLTGNWLGADEGKIQFLAGDTPRTYQKSDVLEVTFGAAVASPVTPTPPPATVTTPNARLPAGAEPEWIGAVYLRNASGMFIPLERLSTMALQTGYAPGFTNTWNLMLVEGPKSTMRLKQGDMNTFVVRLANGTDPRVFTLYPMNANSKRRAAMTDKKNKAYKTVLVDVTRVGVSSYGLTSESALSAGEYCFIPRSSTDAYCFGVDAR